MSEHCLVVTDVAITRGFDCWQATCGCGWRGDVLREWAADEQALAHRIQGEVAAAVEAEREACAELVERALQGSPGSDLASILRARGDK